jgi:tetratricopeptide (TPR) repeat protein
MHTYIHTPDTPPLTIPIQDMSAPHHHHLPAVVRDPRFRAGRTLVQRGAAEQAIDIFVTLLEQARAVHGDDHIETAAAYYEYGNALLRSWQHRQENDEDDDDDETDTSINQKRLGNLERWDNLKQPPSQSAAVKEEGEVVVVADNEKGKVEANIAFAVTMDTEKPLDIKRSAEPDRSASNNLAAIHGETDDDNNDDIELALELMETAWSILDQYWGSGSDDSQQHYSLWTKEQLPRYLTGIGDVLSAVHRHADATDTYCRALSHRQEDLAEFTSSKQSSSPTVNGTNSEHHVRFLQCRRRLVETLVLIAEELLQCPPDQDVVTTESRDMLVSAAERVDYARGYYDKARDELQETVLLMGELVGKGIEVGDEKQDVCFAATLVMAVGTALAEIDEQAANDVALKEPSKKKKKAV